MALTVNQAKKKFRAGKTFWRCLPSGDGRVWINEVCLLGKRVHSQGTMKIIGAQRLDHGPYWNRKPLLVTRGSYYLTDLCGWGTAKCFDTRRKAEKFAEDYKAGRLPDLQNKIIERELEDRLWDEMMADSYHFDAYDY